MTGETGKYNLRTQENKYNLLAVINAKFIKGRNKQLGAVCVNNENLHGMLDENITILNAADCTDEEVFHKR